MLQLGLILLQLGLQLPHQLGLPLLLLLLCQQPLLQAPEQLHSLL